MAGASRSLDQRAVLGDTPGVDVTVLLVIDFTTIRDALVLVQPARLAQPLTDRTFERRVFLMWLGRHDFYPDTAAIRKEWPQYATTRMALQ